MENWLITFIGGGAGVIILRMLSFRQTDGANIRVELWREIGSLRQELGAVRQTCDYQSSLIAKMQRRQHAVRKLAHALKLRVLTLMNEVNEHCRELSRPAPYDLSAEERRMRDEPGYKEGFDALDADEADLETPDHGDELPRP
jgi:hypothetical protein